MLLLLFVMQLHAQSLQNGNQCHELCADLDTRSKLSALAICQERVIQSVTPSACPDQEQSSSSLRNTWTRAYEHPTMKSCAFLPMGKHLVEDIN